MTAKPAKKRQPKAAAPRHGTCGLCGAKDVEVASFRVANRDVDETELRQVPLCSACRKPLEKIVELESETPFGRRSEICANCGVVGKPTERWSIERIKTGQQAGTSRRLWLCKECCAVPATILRLVGPQRVYDAIRVVKSVDALLPSKAVWAQQHKGKTPPKRLGLQ